MIRPVAALVILTLGVNFGAHGASNTLCPGLGGQIVEDQQVREDQLTYEAAVNSLAFIEHHRATTDRTLQWGLRNSEIRVQGYTLLSLAMSSDAEVGKHYRMKFCQWLKTAAWFD
ncbi:hypothetical protein [Nevskia sp.]|uniref:hypothetical protein n=1 Tax=Nevskia sp. TaxID=1929292 RepID=UPI0025F13F0F|nr:hypothetical protein [Nevskia sp.]